ncbi:ABC transporter ATP-binding protein [Lachnoclostridium pacaense]|uniref:ABC transporter ATP-binding protein n=1 Tax=Enterocloster hominis (ex Hitch et al. 2024) TaxID=1917870 RepID=A0ABV1DHU3_9FIRM|nr:ABC transporter ATP-binding protein [Lachnoclostridium pacaense]MCC2877650.1 ABC transporter ATP-binding protein [Lachnoclostridium pacaense]
MEHGKPIIYVKNVRKVYRMGDEEVVALKRINLKIYKGEVCCIFGTSGSGKSTLLNQLAGMEKPTQGQVFIRGKSISRMGEEELAAFRQEHMSFIFQSYNLLPSMTAVENVAMPLMFKGVDRKRREAMAEDLLRRVGLSHRLHHYPSQMSGGQQQRAGIARAFVSRPEVVFADEPTGNLDTKTTAEIMDMVMGFARRFNQTIILVTHDPGMSKYADRIVTLVDGVITGDERKGQ